MSRLSYILFKIIDITGECILKKTSSESLEKKKEKSLNS